MYNEEQIMQEIAIDGAVTQVSSGSKSVNIGINCHYLHAFILTGQFGCSFCYKVHINNTF